MPGAPPDFRPRPPDEPPENLEVRWGWTLQAVYQGRETFYELGRTKLEVTRLQNDLAGHIGHTMDTMDELQESGRRLADGLLKQEGYVSELRDFRTSLMGGWKVTVAVTAFLASVAGSLAVGIFLAFLKRQ